MALTSRDVELIIRAKDQASQAMKGIQQAAMNMGAGVQDASGRANRSLRAFETQTKDAGRSFISAFSGGFTGAAIGAQFASMIADMPRKMLAVINDLDRLRDAALTTNIEVGRLAGMEFAAKMSGASLEAITGSMRGLANAIEQARTQGSDAAISFKLLGVSVEELVGMKPDESFLKIIKALERMPAGLERNKLTMQTLGRSYEELARIIAEGAADFDRTAKQYSNQHQGLKAAAEAANEFNDSIVELNASLKSMVTDSGVIPWLTEGIGKLRDLGELLRDSTGITALLKLASGARNFFGGADAPGADPNVAFWEEHTRKRQAESLARQRAFYTAQAEAEKAALEAGKKAAETAEQMRKKAFEAWIADQKRHGEEVIYVQEEIQRQSQERSMKLWDQYWKELAAHNERGKKEAAAIADMMKGFQDQAGNLKLPGSFGSGVRDGLFSFTEENSPEQRGFQMTRNAIDGVTQSLSDMFMVMGSGNSAKESLRQIALGSVQAIRRMIAEAIAWGIVSRAVGLVSPGYPGGMTSMQIGQIRGEANIMEGFIRADGKAMGGPASGLTWVGEKGPELVKLPAGSYVHSNADSKKMVGGQTIVANIQFNVHAWNAAEVRAFMNSPEARSAITSSIQQAVNSNVQVRAGIKRI